MKLMRFLMASSLAAAGCVASVGHAQESLRDRWGDEVARRLAVTDFDVQRIEIAGAAEGGRGPAMAAVELDGVEYLLDVTPASVRAADFRVLVPDADGSWREHHVAAPRTYRGTVLNVPGSAVAASIDEGQLHAAVALGHDRYWYIQPLSEVIDEAPAGAHVVYRAEDVAPIEAGWCGVDDGPIRPHDHAAPGDGGSNVASGDALAEIAFDADYEFFQANGSDVDDTVADIEAIVNGMNVIFERDTQITHEITTIIVRTTPDDPYSGDNGSALLDQFRTHWTANHGDVRRDVAHLMTGRGLNDVLGIAYLGVVCDPGWGYGLSASRFSLSMHYRIALTAHEVGHNWNAPHCCSACSGCPSCRIMCPCIGGCSGYLTSFGPQAVDAITSFRDTRPCLDKAADFRLSAGPLRRGRNGDFEITGAAPNEEVRIYYSLRGEGKTYLNDLGVTLNLSNAKLGATGTTNAWGDATLTRRMPRPGRIVVIWLQAAQSGQTSNVVLTQIN